MHSRAKQIARTLLLTLGMAALAAGRKYFDDDPLRREPAPRNVQMLKERKISDVYDLFHHTLQTPGEKHEGARAPVPARDVNTLGEVLEGPWYEKRHARQPMSEAQLVAGPGDSHGPAEGPWTVVSAKSEGITPGFQILDAQGRRYFLKFDPQRSPEITTAADVISSKFFYALGYHVPENYIVTFSRERLQLKPGATFRDERGRRRQLTSKDLGEILTKASLNSDGRLRATASLLVKGTPLGPFRFYGTRSDDPNDTVPHEHRRSLRGFHVFCAWLGHDDSRAINTLDTLVEENGVQYVRHYLIDFGSTLGSASSGPNSPRSGFEQFFTWSSAAKEFFTFGLYVPPWSRIRYPDYPSVGRWSSDRFVPEAWTPEYPNPAFENRLPEDTLWAAQQIVSFTDDQIRAIVRTGRYSDPDAERHVADTLIRRRDAIKQAYLRKPLTIWDVRLEGGRLQWDDLAVRYGYVRERPDYQVSWFTFDNDTAQRTAIPGAKGEALPSSGAQYLVAEITAGSESRRVAVYLKHATGSFQIIGIGRAL